MVNKLIALLIFAALLVFPLVSADLQINIKTLADHKVSVFVLANIDAYSLLESYHGLADGTGMYSTNYVGDAEEIKINVKITKDGETVILHKFENTFKNGDPLYLQVIPEDISDNYKKTEDEKAVIEANTSASENVTIESNDTQEQKDDAGLTGNVVENNPSDIKIPKFVYYIIGGALIAGFVLFFGFKMVAPRLKFDSAYKYKSINPVDVDKQLIDAEEKIKKAQEDINRLRNHDKIKQKEEKIRKEQEELEKMKRGEI